MNKRVALGILLIVCPIALVLGLLFRAGYGEIVLFIGGLLILFGCIVYGLGILLEEGIIQG